MTEPLPNSARRPWLALGAALLLTAGAAAGATAVFSARTQTLAEDWTNRLITSARASGAVQVRQTSYRRGLTGSTQTLSVTFNPERSAQPVALLVTNHIQHGPFPGLSGVGQAVIETEVQFVDPAIQEALNRAFASDRPQIRTVIGLGGATKTRIDVPQGRYAEGGDTLTWQALTGRVGVSGTQSNTTLDWPGLQFASTGSRGHIKNLSLSGTTQLGSPNDLLGVGQSTLRIGEISLDGDGLQGAIRGVDISAQGQASGADFYDALLQYNVSSVRLAGQSLSNLKLHLSARHLARQPLSRLGQLINELQASGAETPDQPLTASALTEPQTQALEDNVLALLRGNPVLKIDRLSVGEAGQEVVLTGQASLPRAARLSAAELRALGDQPQGVIGELDLRATLKGSEPSVRALLGGVGGPLSGLGENLQSLVEAGYVRRSGDQLSVDVASVAGRTTLNGQALGDF